MNYQEYLLSQDWKDVKKKFKQNFCEICGTKKNLHLHHLTYRNVELGKERKEDVVTLCSSCHLASHISLTSLSKLSKPSHSTTKIVNRIRNGSRLKRNQTALFLRRKFIAIYGEKGLPPFSFFVRFADKHRKLVGKKYFYKIPNFETAGELQMITTIPV